ncbi:hypothetical protein ACA910_016799 [Epithemia clementina (nom. ined.)]
MQVAHPVKELKIPSKQKSLTVKGSSRIHMVTGSTTNSTSLWSSMSEGVTIVVMTFRRTKQLLKGPTIRNLVPLNIVKEFYLVWNDIQNHEHIALIRNHFEIQNISHKLRIFVPLQNDLNNRFLPIPDVKTEAIFTIDDDWLVTKENFIEGFRWWQQYPDRLVGFTPRKLDIVDGKGVYEYFSKKNYLGKVKEQGFNVLLPGGGLFFRHSFLENHYWKASKPSELAREHVSKYFNGEDILFNFLLPPESRPPILVAINGVESRPQFEPIRKLSGRMEHIHKRESLIVEFNQMLGWPLQLTHDIQTQPVIPNNYTVP